MEHERKGADLDDYKSHYELFDGDDIYVGEDEEVFESMSGYAKRKLAYKYGFQGGYQGKNKKAVWGYIQKRTGGGNKLYKIYLRGWRKGEKKRQSEGDHGPAVRKLKKTL